MTADRGAEPETCEAQETDALMDFFSLPGHLIRRAKQKTTAAFAEIVTRFNLTPIQFAILKVLALRPGVDQADLALLVGLDNSTTGQVVSRLHERGLLDRRREGRRQLAAVTAEGEVLLAEIAPYLAEAQRIVMSPLTIQEQRQLLRLLSKMVGVSTRHYTAPAMRRRR